MGSSSSTVATGRDAHSLDEYECPICMEVLIDVCGTDCKHRFCKFCLNKWFKQSKSVLCPLCRFSIRKVMELPELNAQLEDFVTQTFTDTQKAERETLAELRRVHSQVNTSLQEGWERSLVQVN